MKYRWMKTENCFSGARTFEYEFPMAGEEFLSFLEGWEVRVNRKFRRPVFSATRDGLEMKGILASHVVKVNFTEAGWEQEKEELEAWLEGIGPEGGLE